MTRDKAVEIANDKLWRLFPGQAAEVVDTLIALEVLRVEPESVEQPASPEAAQV